MSISSRATVGSLCSGYGGLELAIREVFGAEPAWLSELPEIQDTPKSKARPNPCLEVLGKHYLGVPILGDLDLIEWARVRRTSVIAAGFPCQPASAAGRQLGDRDPRWKWPGVRTGIAAHLPPLVVLENVAGLVSIQNGALWAGILADLRTLSYAVTWGVFGACLEEVAGCHHRHRVFLLARRIESGDVPPAQRWQGRACGAPPSRTAMLATPAARDGDTRGEGDLAYWQARESMRSNGAPLGAQLRVLFPSPRARDGMGGPGHSEHIQGGMNLRTAVTLLEPERWGRYAWAVGRWGSQFGAPPPPTEIGSRGGTRLTAVFPEWMMGLPAGYVSDILPRNDALRLIGNGVFPRQAAHALRQLIAMFAADVQEFRDAPTLHTYRAMRNGVAA